MSASSTTKAPTTAFPIRSILYLFPANKSSSNNNRILNLTDQIPNADSLPGTALVVAVKSAYAELPAHEEGRLGRYLAQKHHLKTFTLYALPSSTPLATFSAPILGFYAIPITLLPPSHPPSLANPSTPPASPAPPSQPTLRLKMRHGCSRTHTFTYLSRPYIWDFVSGMEVVLRDLSCASSSATANPTAGTRAKFHYQDPWFSSRGVLALGARLPPAYAVGSSKYREGEMEEEGREWELVVVVTLLGVLRREREIRYSLAGHGVPVPRILW